MGKEPIWNPNTSLYTKIMSVICMFLIIGAFGVQVFAKNYELTTVLLWFYILINTMLKKSK